MANYTTFRRIDHIVQDKYGIDPLASDIFDLLAEIEQYALHEVRQHEAHNAPLLAYNVYDNEDLWWILLAYNGITDPEDQLLPGTLIKVPAFSEVNSICAKYRTNKRPGQGVTRI